MRRELYPILIAYAIAVIAFTAWFLARADYEFILYVAVILIVGGLLAATDRIFRYSQTTLWLLLAWAILHMAGGSVPVGGEVLYAKMLWPLIGEPYHVLKYDQVVHAFGFFVATLLAYELLKPSLGAKRRRWALALILAMAGMGFGALNEVLEFVAVIVVPETGVGGYANTAIDLVANLVGAVVAVATLRGRKAI